MLAASFRSSARCPFSTPLEEVAATLGLTAEDFQALQHYSSTDPVEDMLRDLTQELHSDTWFIMHNDCAVVRTRRGTRPGSSWADVLFSILFS